MSSPTRNSTIYPTLYTRSVRASLEKGTEWDILDSRAYSSLGVGLDE